MDHQSRQNLEERLRAFTQFRREHLDGNEKGEAQVFLEHLFLAFGYEGLFQAGAKLEKTVRRRGTGRVSFADLVWRPRLLLEMKKSGEDLSRHYQQAFEYWLDLVPGRPEYVILCNFDEFWIYDLNNQLDDPVDRISIEELADRWEALAFMLPQKLTPIFRNDLIEVTREAAATLVRVANALISRGIPREQAQRFVMQCLIAMVAEDAGLLPDHLFTRVLEASMDGASSYDLLFGLFREMNVPGRTPAGRYEGTPFFNGNVFRKAEAFELTPEETHALHQASSFDWRAVRPEIFGTIFEQSLGKEERHAYGAHFTSGADIQRIVLPTIVRPWRQRIEEATTLQTLGEVENDLLQFRVLDPACGCGNFLYTAYRELRRLESDLYERRNQISSSKTVRTARLSLVQPDQFLGIDINPFAVEIAKVTLMLGKQLAAVEQGDEQRALPLDDLDENFQVDDALFIDWPKADAIIGNPPYLGRRRLIDERGASYADSLKEHYPEVGGVSDYVVYWFRRTQDHLGKNKRAGLVGTNTIRQTDTRKASLDYVIDNGGAIVDAWSSLPWSGDAKVHVSIVNWINGPTEEERVLWLDNGQRRVVLRTITGSLSEDLDLRHARDLSTNKNPKVAFQGQTVGQTEGFVVPTAEAIRLRSADEGSRQAIHPYVSADEILNNPAPGRFVIDLEQEDATTARTSAPAAFEHVRRRVLPIRQANAEKEAIRNSETLAKNPKAKPNRHHSQFLERWWQLSYRRSDFLDSISALDRYLAVPRVAAEHRRPVFVFIDSDTRPSDAIQAFALDDDYSFGVLQSGLHEAWFRGRCSTLKSDLRYTAQSVFNSYPWPQEPSDDDVSSVAKAASRLLEFRHSSTNLGISLADLYSTLGDPGRNQLRNLHEALDLAVLDAYGLAPDDDHLAALLALNAYCADREASGLSVTGPGDAGFESAHATELRIAR